MAGNKNLQAANKAKKDEFYTQLADIENELRHYREHFQGKTVLCNCDDPRVSNFFHYFAYSFEQLGLKRLITTCYKNQHPDLFSRNDHEQAIWLEYLGDRNANRVPDPEEIGIRPLREVLRDRRNGGRPHHPLARRRAHRGFQLPNALPGMQPSQVGDVAHWQGRNKESPGSSWGASGAVGCCVLGARH